MFDLFKTNLGGVVEENGETPPASIRCILAITSLQEEIGRGGQGVVYRARQKSLNRTVALKIMVLGHLATVRHLKRFRLEAEAAVSLNHSSIVSIHEIGERDGCCYFSMNLIEGRQFDEVVRREAISDPSRSGTHRKTGAHRASRRTSTATCIETSSPETSCLIKRANRTLPISLARLVETESTVTRTTEVRHIQLHGSEQASGNNVALTSATDIYGLGAVSYDLLTGYPLLWGEQPTKSVRLVLETDPRQPRLFNPKVNRDLSTDLPEVSPEGSEAPLRFFGSRWPKTLSAGSNTSQSKRDATGLFARGKKMAPRKPGYCCRDHVVASTYSHGRAIVWKSDLFRRPAAAEIAVLPSKISAMIARMPPLRTVSRTTFRPSWPKIGALKVISRTSVMEFRGKHNTRQIGDELGVIPAYWKAASARPEPGFT